MIKQFHTLLAIGFIGMAPAIHAMDKSKTRLTEALKPNENLVERLARNPFLLHVRTLECRSEDLYGQRVIMEAHALAATMKKDAHDT